ncbi:MAG: isopentenyl phosphate kinase [Candidatus Thorarchaeota archaeon]
MVDSSTDKQLWIIKLGGSIITNDQEFMSPNEDVISNLLLILLEFSNKYHFIIVHGAGSFGHPLAKSYQLSKGFLSSKQYDGLILTHDSMLELNNIIVGIGSRLRLPLVSFPPMTMVTTKKGRIISWDVSPIQIALKLNFIPVIFGDVVFDEHQQFSILSGDQIVPFLATKLNATKILMLTDVEGVYTKNPKHDPTAKLLKKLDLSDEDIMKKISAADVNSSGKTRVTGEMGKKLDELLPALKQGTETYVLSGLDPKYLRIHFEQPNNYSGTKLVNKQTK